MHVVTLARNGKLSVAAGDISARRFLGQLRLPLALDPECTLRSFFLFLEEYPDAAAMDDFLPSALAHFRTCAKTGCLLPGAEYLVLEKTVEMVGFPGKPRLEIYSSLRGVSNGQAGELSTNHLELLLDMPLRLGRLKHIVFGDRVDVLEFGAVFNLFEFIDGISWELGFHGTPMACQLRS